ASVARIDFADLGLPAGVTLTVRAGAIGQGVLLRNAGSAASTIDGSLRFEAASDPSFRGRVQEGTGRPSGAGGSVGPSAALSVSSLGTSWAEGGTLSTSGLVQGGAQLRITGARITGGGRFVSNDIHVATVGHANNPVNGS